MPLPDIAVEEVREKGIHEVFIVSVLLKGVGALFEALVGAMLLGTNRIVDLVVELIHNELLDDPNGFIASHFHQFLAPTHEAQIFGGLYLLSHGTVKLALMIGLLYNKLWAYPASLAVFALFVSYQMVRFARTHSLWLLVLTVLDLIIMWLIWHEYRKRQKNDATMQG